MVAGTPCLGVGGVERKGSFDCAVAALRWPLLRSG